MLYLLLFIVVIVILSLIMSYLLKIYGIDAKTEIKRLVFDVAKELPVDSDDEFNETYDLLRKKYEKQEKEIRKSISLVSKLVFLLGIIAVLFLLFSIIKPIMFIVVFLCIIFATALLAYKNKSIGAMQKKLKPEFLSNFFKDINEGFMYDENGEISERSYKLSGFDKTFNIFKASNYLEGFLDDDTKIILSDIVVKYEKNFDNKKSVENIFEGTFGYVNVEKRFTEGMKILNKKIESHNLEENNVNKTKKFNDIFVVHANEETFKAIFTKEIINMITGYIKNFNIKLELIILGSNVYFRFHNKDLIDYKKFGSNEEKLCLWKYYCMIDLIYIIVDKINSL